MERLALHATVLKDIEDHMIHLVKTLPSLTVGAGNVQSLVAGENLCVVSADRQLHKARWKVRARTLLGARHHNRTALARESVNVGSQLALVEQILLRHLQPPQYCWLPRQRMSPRTTCEQSVDLLH